MRKLVNISQKERTDALISIFKFLGASYDFGFNFADTSQLFVLRFNIMPLMVKETYHSSLPNEQAILHSQLTILSITISRRREVLTLYYLHWRIRHLQVMRPRSIKVKMARMHWPVWWKQKLNRYKEIDLSEDCATHHLWLGFLYARYQPIQKPRLRNHRNLRIKKTTIQDTGIL